MKTARAIALNRDKSTRRSRLKAEAVFTTTFWSTGMAVSSDIDDDDAILTRLYSKTFFFLSFIVVLVTGGGTLGGSGMGPANMALKETTDVDPEVIE